MAKLAVKVLNICQRDDPSTGGAVRVAVEYVKRLEHYGIDAHCLFLYGPPGYFQHQLKGRAHYLNIQDSKEVWKFPRFLKFVKHFKPQVVHHHDGLLWTQVFTLIHPSYKKVVHAHLGTVNQTSRLKGAASAWIQKISIDSLVCITEAIRADYSGQLGYSDDNTITIYNGVDRKAFYPPTEVEKIQSKKKFGWDFSNPVIGYVGRLECKMKGVDDFIRTLKKLPARYKGLVVGDGPDRLYLEKLAQKLGLEKRILFTGLLEQPYTAYAAMDVFCMTSHHEPFGLVVAEAMACQIPVVGFPCRGGVNEILNENTGYVLPVREPGLMAKKIFNVLEPEVPNLDKTKDGQKLLKMFCWDNSAAKLSDLYKNLLVVY